MGCGLRPKAVWKGGVWQYARRKAAQRTVWKAVRNVVPRQAVRKLAEEAVWKYVRKAAQKAVRKVVRVGRGCMWYLGTSAIEHPPMC